MNIGRTIGMDGTTAGGHRGGKIGRTWQLEFTYQVVDYFDAIMSFQYKKVRVVACRMAVGVDKCCFSGA